MKKYLSNLVNMIRATLLYCANNAAVTAVITNFAAAKTAIDNKLVLIDQLDQIAGGTSIGVTLDTNAIRTAMTNIAFKCCNALTAYAVSVNNNTLKQKVNFTKTALNRLKKDEIDDTCQTIHDEADLNIAVAGGFGYLATDVTDLATAISLYRTAMQNPRQAIISKTLAIEQITSITRDIVDNSFRLGLDKMVNTLDVTSPVFVSGYYHSREVINLGSTTAKVRGIMRNENGTFLVGAKFYLTLTGVNQKVDETTAGAGGKYGIANLAANDYDLYWEHPFYQLKTETNVHISAGKEITRNVTLLNLPPITGTINPGQIINIFNNSNLFWTPGVTVKIKNTTNGTGINSITYYLADNPGDTFSGQNGTTLTPGQEETHTITAAEFKACLNIQNQSPNPGTYEISIS
jgi:hypothetical protein